MVTFHIESLVEGNVYKQVSPDFNNGKEALAWLRENAKGIMSDASIEALYLCACDTLAKDERRIYRVKRLKADGPLVLSQNCWRHIQTIK